MSFAVLLTDDAVRDLEELFAFVESHDVPGKAEDLLDRIQGVIDALGETPNRGVYPKELVALGVREVREVFYKPYRIIYRVIGDNVYVLLIADGRRDMQSLLQRRLLQP